VFKGIANFASMLKQASQLGGKLKTINEQLKKQTVTGTAGGGMVEVEANGLGEIVRIRIDPALVEKGEREMIEDLTPAAANQALTKAKQLHAEAVQGMTSDMNLPGLDEALSQATGAPVPDTSSSDDATDSKS